MPAGLKFGSKHTNKTYKPAKTMKNEALLSMKRDNQTSMHTTVKRLLVVISFVCVLIPGQTQDFQQYTQYINMQGLINPAYTGSRGTYSGLMNYRNQWTGFAASPKTLGFNFHGPVPVENLSAGLVVMSESIGLNSNVDMAIASAYKVNLTRELILSLGLQLGFSSLQFDAGSLILESGNDPVYDAYTDSYFRPNTGVGAFVYTDRYFAGFSMPKMLTHSPEKDTETIKTSFSFKTMHMFLYGGYVFDVDNDIKVKPTLLMKSIYGAPLTFDIGVYGFYRDWGSVGLAFRTGSDVIIATEFRVWEQLYVGYSFDYPITKLSKVSYGSHEISLRIDLEDLRIGLTPASKGVKSIRYF